MTKTDASATSSTNRSARSQRNLLLSFLTVYIFWGSTFLAIRYGVQSIPPLLMQGTRHLFAGVALYALARSRGAEAPASRHWLSAVIIGGLLLLGGNGTLAVTERVLPSSVAALIVSSVSLWMALIEWLRPHGVRPTARAAAGLVLGFIGVAVLVSPASALFHSAENPVRTGPAVALLFASLLWAIGSILVRHVPLPRSTLLAAGMYAIAGGALLWIVGLAIGEGAALHLRAITPASALAMLYLAIFGSLFGLAAYSYILQHAPPSRAATYAYVNPIVAVILGWAFAGEPITLHMFFAAVIIIISVVMVITAPHAPAARDLAVEPVPSE